MFFTIVKYIMADSQKDAFATSTSEAEVKEDSPVTSTAEAEVKEDSPVTSAESVPEALGNSKDSVQNGSLLADSDDWLSTQIVLAFQPVRPFYDSVKSSNKFIGNLLGVVENLGIQIMAILSVMCGPLGYSKRMRKQTTKDVIGFEVDKIEKSLYKIWFVVHKRLQKSVDCIAKTYEAIVPLRPGDEPWDSIHGEGKSIAQLCFMANMMMACRLLEYAKDFLEDGLPFLKREKAVRELDK